MSENAGPQGRMVGRSVKRFEDPRLIWGRGEYIEDLRIDGMADVAFLRSPHAHARIKHIDTEQTRKMPGVIAAVTHEDLHQLGGVPVEGDMNIPEHPPLARETVKYVGDPIVAVIAENRYLAQDALDTVFVEYESLPAIVDARMALEGDAPLVHDQFDSNVVMRRSFESGNVDEAFENADHTLQVSVGHSRVAALPIETRGGIGKYDPDGDAYTLWLSSQAAWLARPDLAKALGVSEEQVRVITPDVGGAFGGKMTVYREDILLLGLAKLIGRPVRWIATRSEDLRSSMHGREAHTDGEVAFDNDGTIRALRVRTIANMGSYLMKFSGRPPARMLLFPTGAYDIRHLQSEIVGVFTNTGPMGPYRGAGRPEAAYFIERVVNEVAHELRMDQATVRRRNFVPADAFPYENAANVTYDTGNYELALDKAMEFIEFDRLVEEVQTRRDAGELVGVGFASCVEVSGGGAESGRVTLDCNGRVTAITGSSPHGQGLETSFAQILSDELSIPVEEINVTYGDTAHGPPGRGTMSSRSLQLGGSALLTAAREVRKTLFDTASEMLEVALADLTLKDGMVIPVGAPAEGVAVGKVVRHYLEQHSPGDEATGETARGISSELSYQADGESFPFGTTIVVVSIDRDTGRPTIERFVSVDDFGNVINPVLVDGQIVGGAVQGISETLWEQVVYDDHGQLLTGTLMDYALPKASQLPTLELMRTVTPTPRNPLGAKGAGEAGTVHAPPAVANAIADALRAFDAPLVTLPIGEQDIWRIIHGE